MTYRAIARPSVPCSECSAKTTPAISGLSRGAKNTNQPWSRRSRSVRPGSALAALERDHLRRAGLARHVAALRSARCRPCPPPFTTIHSPSWMRVEVSGLNVTRDFGSGGRHRLPPAARRRSARTRCGVRARPAVGDRRHVDGHRDRRHRHLALADRHRDRLARVPLLAEPRPASTRSTARCPCTSFGRSMPLFSPRPSSVAHLWILSIADHVAERVEVDVARLLDGVPQVDACRARPSAST